MLVHLPIGVLVLVALWILFFEFRKKKISRRILDFTLATAALTAIASASTGYLLSRSGEYEETILSRHQWLGISVAFVTTLVWLLFHNGQVKRRSLKFFSVLILLLLIGAGHLGATLTHGSDYLSGPLREMSKGDEPSIDLAAFDLNTTAFYPGLIKPIFEKRCTSCHGEGKQKGKLRLDKPEYILKGGKSGVVIEPGKQDEGELLYRIHLALQDEDHMPPKEKPQPTEQELMLLRLWVTSGADFTRPVSSFFTRLQLDSALGHHDDLENAIPDSEVAPPDENLVNTLIGKGVSIVAVAQGSNYLSVSFISVPKDASQLLKDLVPLSENIIWMRLSDCDLGDGSMESLKQFGHLTRLSLDNTKLTNDGLTQVSSLTALRSLNLNGTATSADGILKLSPLAMLRHLYLYQTRVAEGDHQKLQAAFKNTRIDFGDYNVPTLASDTLEVKPAKR